MKLSEILKSEDLSLWGQSTSSVRWFDTDVFRIFQCDHHYIIVYPPNWSERGFDIMLIPGEVPVFPVKAYTIKRDDYISEMDTQGGIWNSWMALSGQKIGFDNVYLGMPFPDFLDSVDRKPYEHIATDLGQYGRNQRGSWLIDKDTGGYFNSLNEHIFRLRYSRGDGPKLTRQRLSIHEVKLVNQGIIGQESPERD